MECNKEEAIRAKEIAEKKMQNDDFVGARKIALKAQKLFPELENISQLLVVCDVHCSAQNKICGSEKDWYGILQVERFSDEATIKKQYRRLALALHPDKNKFPGAEAAFKLIGEANMLLSDPAKRYLYDSKCRVSVKPTATQPPTYHQNWNPYVMGQYGVQNNTVPNVPNTQFGGLNHHQPTQPGLSNCRTSFWTNCPFCSMKYQYYRDFVNRSLRCQNCSKPFIAYDLGPQSVPPGSNLGQPKVASQYNGGTPFSHMGYQQNFSNTTMGSESVSKRGSSTKVGGGSKSIDAEKPKEGVGTPNIDAEKPKEFTTSRNTSKKRGRKVESSDSSDTETSVDTDEDMAIEEEISGNLEGQASGTDGVHPTRRSSRQRQHVTYNENLSDDDDLAAPPKKSKGSQSSRKGKEEKEEAMDNEVSKTGKLAGFTDAVDTDENKQKEADTVNGNAKESVVIDDCDTNPNPCSTPQPEYYDFPDPEFSDFDKDKEEKCFAVDQVWACYDAIDGMPRFYARVRQVFSPEFKLRITWLEPNPEDQCEIDWFNEGLPVASGRYVHGESEETTNRLTFSHQVHFEKGSGRCSYLIYPRKGETWALFRDWDIRWCNEQEKDTKFNFEIVEVVSDLVEGVGVRVAYLDKVKGFVSLFQRTTEKCFLTFLIPPNQLLRFSHRIPSFRMTGKERECVPEGSFELDPASLASNLNDFYYPEDVKMETENTDAKDNGLSASPEEKLKFMMGSENTTTPKKSVEFQGEVSKLRRSPRGSSCITKKEYRVDASQGLFADSPKEKVKSTMGSEKMTTPKKRVEFEGWNGPEGEVSNVRRSPRELNSIVKKENHVNASQSLFAESPKGKVKSMMGSEKMTTPKKRVEFEGLNGPEGEVSKVRRSPRELNSICKKENHVDASQSLFAESPKGKVKSTMGSEKMTSPKKRVEFEGLNGPEGEVSKLRRSPRELNTIGKKENHVDASQSLFVASPKEKVKSTMGFEKMTTTNNRVEFEGLNGPEGEVPKLRRSLRESNSIGKNENHHVDASQSFLAESTKGKVKSTVGSKKMTTPKKRVEFEGMNDPEGEVSKIRRSPRKSNTTSQCATQEQTSKVLDCTKYDRHGDNTESRGSASPCQAYEKSNSTMMGTIPVSLSKSPKKISGEFYDFAGDKSEGKFQLGQIWAIYSNSDGLPKSYGQVKKIESSPFRLNVAFLEVCAHPKNPMLPICCGTFKIQGGKAKIFSPSSFSHVLKVELNGKNRFEIYPREGEIWAIYKNWSADLACSDPENCKYDIVEVLEDNGHCTKVSSLARLNGFNSVFKVPRSQRSNTGILEIPRVEIARFSHQIPAFQLTRERDGRLRGCWELDQASIPGNSFSIN